MGPESPSRRWRLRPQRREVSGAPHSPRFRRDSSGSASAVYLNRLQKGTASRVEPPEPAEAPGFGPSPSGDGAEPAAVQESIRLTTPPPETFNSRVGPERPWVRGEAGVPPSRTTGATIVGAERASRPKGSSNRVTAVLIARSSRSCDPCVSGARRPPLERRRPPLSRACGTRRRRGRSVADVVAGAARLPFDEAWTQPASVASDDRGEHRHRGASSSLSPRSSGGRDPRAAEHDDRGCLV